MYTIMIAGDEYRVRGPRSGVEVHARALLEMLNAPEALIRRETLARVDKTGRVTEYSRATYITIVRRP